MRPPRNSPWWSSCMLLSARHFSLGKRHFLLGFWHFSLGWCVCNSLCHNGLREMSFPNRLNNRLKKSIGDYAMLRPYASWKMDWKVVERWIGDSVSSLLGNQRYSVPIVCPTLLTIICKSDSLTGHLSKNTLLNQIQYIYLFHLS